MTMASSFPARRWLRWGDPVPSGAQLAPASRGRDRRRNSNLSARASFERSEILQALIDISAVVAICALVVVFATAIAAALLILFPFVRP